MRRRSVSVRVLWIVVGTLLAVSVYEASAAEKFTAGMQLPDFTVPGPTSGAVQKYLGLKSSEPFTIAQVGSKLVLIEIMSVLCQVCQENAPNLNNLYKLMRKDSDLDKDVKLLAISSGDEEEDLAIFRKAFRAKYAMFPDPETEIFEKLGEPKTPYLILATKDGKILMTHSGVIHDVQAMLREIKSFSQKQ